MFRNDAGYTQYCLFQQVADFLLDDCGSYYFLEMNTLPGMTSTSLLPKSVATAGVSFEKLIKNIIEMGL